MSFGGSAQSMVQSIKYNLGQIRSRKRNKFDSAKRIKTEYDFPKVSKVELEKIKIKFKQKIKKQKQRELLFALISTIIFFGVIYLLYKNI